MRFVLSLFALSLAMPVLAGESAAEKHAKVIAPFVDEHTYWVGHLDVSKINNDVLSKLMEMFAPPPTELEKAKTFAATSKSTFLKSGGKDIYMLMNWIDAMDNVLIVAPLAKDADVPALKALVSQIPFQAEVKNDILIARHNSRKARGEYFKAKAVPEFAKAFEALGDGTAQIVFLPPYALKRAMIETHSTLPKELGGGQTVALDFIWAALRIDAIDKLGAKIIVQAADAKAAQDISKAVNHALDTGSKTEVVNKTFPDLAKIIPIITPKVQDDRLTITLNDKDLSTVLLPVVAKMRDSASRTTSVNNLKQMALAMYNFHDAFGSFPARAIADANGKPLLSWRVHILPYIEGENLYKQFHLNEPWDSEHNKKLIAQMPMTYRNPASLAAEGKTTYLVPVGPKTIFEGKKGMPIQKITDGTSNTILILDVDDSRAVPWTQPEDYKIDPQNPAAGLVRPGSGGFNAALADGSVRLFPANINPATLKAMFTASGGEVIGDLP